MAGLIAEGTLYLNRKVDGVAQGRVKVPGLTRFAITPQSEKKEATSKDKGKYGQVVASVLLQQAPEFAVTISDVDGPALAMALMGDLETLNVGGGSVTTEEVTAKLDVYVDLAQRNITAGSVVVKDETESTTYEEGTDYEVNYAMGWIRALPGGDISTDDELHIDYAHGAIAGQRVRGSTRAEVRGEMVLDGRNLADGRSLVITVDEAVVATESEVDFMSDDFVELAMSGTMVTQDGKSQPYIVDYGLTLS
jgi:hypothetical protein